jgi:hypothetical protein
MAWTREFDTTYQTHYWYDAATGASSWTEPPGWSEPSVEAAFLQSGRRRAPGLRGDGADHAPVAVLLLLPREFL